MLLLVPEADFIEEKADNLSLSTCIFSKTPAKFPNAFPRLSEFMRQKILVVFQDPTHSDSRRDILEKAGFEVVAVTDMLSLRDACEKQTFKLILLGYSIPPAEKRHIWLEVKDGRNKTPILELHAGQTGELDNVNFSHRQSAHDPPDAFLETVQSILGKKWRSAAS